ncbi:MAG: carbohydrate ABC transporter permease [Chloroflexia bacterium]|nr:carbohydrate ABC transporter permease [Chloroflexia bacterium]MDQ3410799.1 carbohydrate ABC transporter permease [Chloroflexota bacterium]
MAMTARARRRRIGFLRSAAVHLTLSATMLLLIVPFLWLLSTSFKLPEDVFTKTPAMIPPNPTFANYAYVLTETMVPRYFLNSLVVASATAIIGTAITSLAAYALSRFQFRGKLGYMTMLLATQMFPAALFLAPLYIVLRSYGLINSLLGLIVAYSTFVIPFCTWMLKGYFDGIPADLEEAAMVDGASRLAALRQIILPLAAPGLATAVLFAFLLGWQEFLFAIAFVQSDQWRTLPVGIALMDSMYGVSYTYLMAAAVIVTIPVVILFAFLQRYLIRGLTAGAVKG